MQHKFQILDVAEFDILEDAHECVIMSINDIPKKTPHSSQPPIPPTNTQITNVTFNAEEERLLDDDKVNN